LSQPAPDVVSDVVVDDGCRRARLVSQECGPAEVDHGGEQPLLVAEVVVEGRARLTPAASHIARVEGV